MHRPSAPLRTDCDFFSRGTRCSAWLYRPPGVSRPPVVVMAHGFAAEKTFRLPDYAERFAERGLAVLLFDYRNFGGSEGQPRNWVSHWRHVQDWQAAVAHVRTLEEVDSGHIALWGTSYSGGHVIATAARDPSIAGLVAQVPMVDVPGSLGQFGLRFSVRAVGHAVRDWLSTAFLRKPHCVPVVARPSEFAAMNRPGCYEGYLAIVPPDSDWKNSCPARVLLSSLFCRPTKVAHRVKCPALVILALRDQLIPAATIEQAAARMPRSQVIRLDQDHFQPYLRETFEDLVRRQADFLIDCLHAKVETVQPA